MTATDFYIKRPCFTSLFVDYIGFLNKLIIKFVFYAFNFTELNGKMGLHRSGNFIVFGTGFFQSEIKANVMNIHTATIHIICMVEVDEVSKSRVDYQPRIVTDYNVFHSQN